jgi:hypothetical protein
MVGVKGFHSPIMRSRASQNAHQCYSIGIHETLISKPQFVKNITLLWCPGENKFSIWSHRLQCSNFEVMKKSKCTSLSLHNHLKFSDNLAIHNLCYLTIFCFLAKGNLMVGVKGFHSPIMRSWASQIAHQCYSIGIHETLISKPQFVQNVTLLWCLRENKFSIWSHRLQCSNFEVMKKWRCTSMSLHSHLKSSDNLAIHNLCYLTIFCCLAKRNLLVGTINFHSLILGSQKCQNVHQCLP